jgi:hypothetical protein
VSYIDIIEKSIRESFMTRKSKDEKRNFRSFLSKELLNSGYSTAEHVKFKNINLMSNNIDKCSVIFTAHYDTPAKSLSFFFYPLIKLCEKFFGGLFLLIPFFIIFILIMCLLTILKLDFILYILCIDFFLLILNLLHVGKNKNNMNDNTSGVISLLVLANKLKGNSDVGFIFFDNEEKNLLGSKAFAKDYYSNSLNFKDKLIVNLDCVSGTSFGDKLIISTSFKNANTQSSIRKIINKIQSNSSFSVKVKKGLSSSDYKSFYKNSSIGICLYKKSLIMSYYLPNVHTNKDTILVKENIESLCTILLNSILKNKE